MDTAQILFFGFLGLFLLYVWYDTPDPVACECIKCQTKRNSKYHANNSIYMQRD